MFERLMQYPAAAAFAGSAAVFRGVESVFVSNTYPIHCSVATGVTPEHHGLTANTQPEPLRRQVWNDREAQIRAETLWQTARRRGLSVASVLWPVTAGSKSIRWNVPEVIAPPGKSQILTSLRAGGKALQLRLFLRYGKLLDGVNQPALDNFSALCMADILRRHKPGLALIHLTAFDTLCHGYGTESPESEAGLAALDRNLSVLLDAAGTRDVLVFSDHSQCDVHTVLTPNRLLPPGPGYAECCGGTAFFHPCGLDDPEVERRRELFAASEGFGRFLTESELKTSGYRHAAFGFCAAPGYCYETHDKPVKATHGYPLDTPDYKVFYMARGFGLTPGIRQGGSLLDIAGLVRENVLTI
jgi:predicted AlkP superfamily pyrophosphatase or phosphodiesterase